MSRLRRRVIVPSPSKPLTPAQKRRLAAARRELRNATEKVRMLQRDTVVRTLRVAQREAHKARVRLWRLGGGHFCRHRKVPATMIRRNREQDMRHALKHSSQIGIRVSYYGEVDAVQDKLFQQALSAFGARDTGTGYSFRCARRDLFGTFPLIDNNPEAAERMQAMLSALLSNMNPCFIEFSMHAIFVLEVAS